MSDTDETVPTGGAQGSAAAPATAATATATVPVRMSLRPPSRFTAKSDFNLWFMRFELYTGEAKIPDGERVKELLPLLDDEPFRAVSQMGLVGSTEYAAVKECLRLRYGQSGTELEWQFKLQGRVQESGESLAEFAGSLRFLASKAFPGWTDAQRQELARNQFIQGILSPSIQLRLMREMPASLETALEEAGKLESIETAQKRLQRVKTSTGALPVAAAVGESETPTPQANALKRGSGIPLDPRVDELTKEVKRLTQELAQLRGEKGEQRPPRSAPRRNPNIVCWNCRGRGHIQQYCPQPRDQQPLNFYRPPEQVNRRPSN